MKTEEEIREEIENLITEMKWFKGDVDKINENITWIGCLKWVLEEE